MPCARDHRRGPFALSSLGRIATLPSHSPPKDSHFLPAEEQLKSKRPLAQFYFQPCKVTSTNTHTHAHTPDFHAHQISASPNDLHVGKVFVTVRVIIRWEFSLSPLPVHYCKCGSCTVLPISTIPCPNPSASRPPRLWNAHGECPKPACNRCPKEGPLRTKRTLLRNLSIFLMVLSFCMRLSARKHPQPCQSPTPLQGHRAWELDQVQLLSAVERAAIYLI